ncbi:MAG: hypothetical protein CMJ54_10475 [Planctomycetaceae bacterium]|nr:hypothetical protein [Planctomycetaceae bacterium]
MDYQFRDPNRFATNHIYGIGETNLAPSTIVGVILIAFIFAVGSRKLWILALALVICLTPPAQRLVVAGIDFQTLRLVGLIAVVALMLRGAFRGLHWSRLDLWMIGLATLPAIMLLLRGHTHSLMNTLGESADMLMMYAIGRAAIRSLDDVSSMIVGFLVVTIPISVGLAIEKSTGRNFFSLLGGVPEFTAIRYGKLRAQAAFDHPIMAGCWFAATIPLFAAARRSFRSEAIGLTLAWFGVFMAVVCVVATSSSTPMGAAAISGVALLLFRFRSHFRPSLPYILMAGVFLHFLTQSGLHGIIYTRFSFVTGSTGYHRYALVEATLQNINQWFLIGCGSTYSWGWGMDDVTHQYVSACVRGGIIMLIVLVGTLIISFRNAGELMRSPDPRVAWVGYCFGVSVLAHVVSFLGVSYFGQIYLITYMTLGGLQSLAASHAVPKITASSEIFERPGLVASSKKVSNRNRWT